MFGYIIRGFKKCADYFIETFISEPFYTVYREGPRPFFWANQTDAFVCSTLTTLLPPTFWNGTREEMTCKNIIRQHYNSYEVLLKFIIYLHFMWTLSKISLSLVQYVFKSVYRSLQKFKTHKQLV